MSDTSPFGPPRLRVLRAYYPRQGPDGRMGGNIHYEKLIVGSNLMPPHLSPFAADGGSLAYETWELVGGSWVLVPRTPPDLGEGT